MGAPLHIMVQVLYFLLATSFNIVFSMESKRTVKWMYRPYGPHMCRELCSDMKYSFIYNIENLACLRFLKLKYSKRYLHLNRETFTCTHPKEKTNTLTGRSNITGVDICTMYSEADYQFKNLQKPTDVTSAGNQTFVEDFHNITLHEACYKGILCVVEYIVSQGIDEINSRGRLGRTPVMSAARNGHKEVFDYLVEEGCDLLGVDEEGNNVLHLACAGGNADLVNRVISLTKLSIESRGHRGMTPVMLAAAHGQREVFDLLVSKGCKPTVVDDKKQNILHLMCSNGHVNMTQTIISLGILSIESRCNAGMTPLMNAAIRGKRQVFDLLLSKGCDLNAVDDMKSNILHLACYGGHISMVKHLLTLEDVRGMYNVKNSLGLTPGQMAEMSGQKAVVHLLKMNKQQQIH